MKKIIDVIADLDTEGRFTEADILRELLEENRELKNKIKELKKD